MADLAQYPAPGKRRETVRTLLPGERVLTIVETHSYWICPVWWGVAAMIGVAPRDRGAGLTQAKSGACVAFVGICRPVPPV